MSHFIEKCHDCKAIISQCKCPSVDKEVRWSVCEKCKFAGMQTWHDEIEKAMKENGDSFDNLVGSTLSDVKLHKKFGGSDRTVGKPFTLWTKDWVYFPLWYDNQEWAGSAPRYPGGKAMDHQGGC